MVGIVLWVSTKKKDFIFFVKILSIRWRLLVFLGFVRFLVRPPGREGLKFPIMF